MYRHSYRGAAGALEAFGQAPEVQGEGQRGVWGVCWRGMTGWFVMGIFGPGKCVDWGGRAARARARGRGLGDGAVRVWGHGCRAVCRGGVAARLGLLRAFLAGYAGVTGPLERAFVGRVAAHWGVHVAYWPTRVEWG